MLDIFKIKNNNDFEKAAIKTFQFQYHYNPVYRKYVEMLGISHLSVKKTEQIPFLPIVFFKTDKVYAGDVASQHVFSSSGTTGSIRSKHYIKDIRLYEEIFLRVFSSFYGSPRDYVIIGLLPGYLERQESSLVYMVNHLINLSGKQESGFYLNDHKKLFHTLMQLESRHQKVILFGVTFALLEFARNYTMKMDHTILIETGGMKGRGQELVREELHGFLQERLGVQNVHSEYGMTELLSQAYAKKINQYDIPPWMKVLVRDPYDPFTYLSKERNGGLNIIDLGNVYSSSFIETEDLGKINSDGSFQVLGRIDHSDIRGCSLLV